MQWLTWAGFFASIVLLLVVSRKSLWLALFTAGITLGFFTLPLHKLGAVILKTLSDPSIILLALSMGVIPLIGGVMGESGEIDHLIGNLRVGKRAVLALSPALMGMLPMPGGALLSAPVVEKAGTGLPNKRKVAINIWFRHLFILIYPLSPALIASAKIAGLGVYNIIIWLIPGFVFALFLGWLFFLNHIKGEISYTSGFSLPNLLIPLCIILLAPFLDFTLQRLFKFPVKEIATIIGVSSSLLLSLLFSTVRLSIKGIFREMRPWNFFLIIIGMFIYLNIFKVSTTARLFASLVLPKTALCVLVGFILGLVTGRVQLPASIVLPVYLTTYGSISLFMFSITYTSIFFGYIISPVHPCVSISCEYFNTQIKDFLRVTAVPVFIIIAVILAISLLFVQ